MTRINVLLGNLFLPVIWMALTGEFSPVNFAVGFLISSLCLWLVKSPEKITFFVYISRLMKAIRFLCFFIYEVLAANIWVAWEVLTPRHHMRPAIIAIPLDNLSDFEITTLANVITLTPGTLSLDVSPDKDTLYVHAMWIEDPDAFRKEIKIRYEQRVKEVFK